MELCSDCMQRHDLFGVGLWLIWLIVWGRGHGVKVTVRLDFFWGEEVEGILF